MSNIDVNWSSTTFCLDVASPKTRFRNMGTSHEPSCSLRSTSASLLSSRGGFFFSCVLFEWRYFLTRADNTLSALWPYSPSIKVRSVHSPPIATLRPPRTAPSCPSRRATLLRKRRSPPRSVVTSVYSGASPPPPPLPPPPTSPPPPIATPAPPTGMSAPPTAKPASPGAHSAVVCSPSLPAPRSSSRPSPSPSRIDIWCMSL
mmetsp:Transcript_106916/g.310375  ORF Transcript_106916/g.310375 Transcript_106916/m.310375 type:complete len:203 (-) Transcript_106916:371-979(-)